MWPDLRTSSDLTRGSPYRLDCDLDSKSKSHPISGGYTWGSLTMIFLYLTLAIFEMTVTSLIFWHVFAFYNQQSYQKQNSPRATLWSLANVQYFNEPKQYCWYTPNSLQTERRAGVITTYPIDNMYLGYIIINIHVYIIPYYSYIINSTSMCVCICIHSLRFEKTIRCRKPTNDLR